MADQRLVALAWLALAAGSPGCADDDIYVMSQRYELKGDERTYAGGGCQLAISHGVGGDPMVHAGGGLTDGDLFVAEGREGDAFVVVVRSQGEELAHRVYSEGMLLSRQRDQFTITTRAGRLFELTYWGGRDCETDHLLHEDAGSAGGE